MTTQQEDDTEEQLPETPTPPPISFLLGEISLHFLELYINGILQCVHFFGLAIFTQCSYSEPNNFFLLIVK